MITFILVLQTVVISSLLYSFFTWHLENICLLIHRKMMPLIHRTRMSMIHRTRMSLLSPRLADKGQSCDVRLYCIQLPSGMLERLEGRKGRGIFAENFAHSYQNQETERRGCEAFFPPLYCFHPSMLLLYDRYIHPIDICRLFQEIQLGLSV